MKNRVKELREAKHLTQTGLALKVGSTQQTISKIEREIGVPKLDLALIMADFFNVTLEYFTISCCYIGGNIDIQASFSGQMPWSFYFVTIFSQPDADIFF